MEELLPLENKKIIKNSKNIKISIPSQQYVSLKVFAYNQGVAYITEIVGGSSFTAKRTLGNSRINVYIKDVDGKRELYITASSVYMDLYFKKESQITDYEIIEEIPEDVIEITGG